MKLVVASANKGKLDEIRAVLSGVGVEPVAIGELVPDFDVAETGTTFLENARLKAEAAFKLTGQACMADDSGLCVVGLGLEPGVKSSRYAGENRTDAERNDYLLDKMRGLDGSERDAWFACVIYAIVPRNMLPPRAGVRAIARYPGGFLGVTVEGRLNGRIGYVPGGSGGFGYDPLFLPAQSPQRRLAQYSMAEKNKISHRGQALAAFAALLGIA